MAEDPVRLFDEGGSELMHTLLSAAREEQPHAAAVRRTLAAVGVGAAVASVSASAAGAVGAQAATGAASLGSAKGLASSAFLVAAKWLAVGAVAGVVATSTVYRVARAPLPSAPPKVEQVVAPPVKPAPRSAQRATQAPAQEVSEAPTPVVSAPVVIAEPVASARPVVVEAPLAAEVLALDSARQALAAGNAARALQSLNAYEADFSKPRMLPEALYLRLEALTLQGDKLGTEAVARRLLRAYPGGPHAARARAILGQSQ